MKKIHLVIAIAGAMVLSAMPVETYAQLLAGTSGSGDGKVYAYQGGTNWTAISPPLGDSVLDIVQFNGTLYAATMSTNLSGEVWRYDGGTSWTVIGTKMNNEVCALEIYNGQLYAGTAWAGGKLYRYNAISNRFDYVGSVSGFTGIEAMYSSSYGYLQLGDIETDLFGRYDGTNLYFDADFGNSCVLDFAEYNNSLYAGTEECAYLFGSTNGINWSVVLGCYGAYDLWELEPFQGQLYLGYDNGQLAYMDSSNVWHSVLIVSDSIISMVAGGNTMLYFGTGAEAAEEEGIGMGSGTGYVYAYTGNGATNATLISGPMGDGVQCLYYPPDPLLITPALGFTATGCVGGPFTVMNETFSLTNTGTNSLDWSLANTSSWLDASPGGGTLTVGGTTNVTVSLDSKAYFLAPGNYTATVWLTNLNDNVEQSRRFTLSVNSPPAITTQPTNQTVMAGGTVTFSVTASGTVPLNYQWQFNGAGIAGATNATLTLINVQLPQAGNYAVKVINGYCSIPSSNALLTVLTGPPQITTQPTNQVALEGTATTFTVGVTGSPPLYFQWRLNGTNLPNGIITTVAGSGNDGLGDGGQATNASLAYPEGVAVDGFGNLFIADTLNNVIREVAPNGFITTVAGGGNDTLGDGGLATNASLLRPSGMAVDASGNLFVADTGNNRISEVDSYGIITTVAGNGSGSYSGDGGLATNARLDSPEGVAVDASGNLFIADTDNRVIREVDTNGIITTVAGGGNDGLGDNGPATSASLTEPYGVAVDAFGNLFIADSGDHRIREVDTNGFITTVAGNGSGSYSGDGGLATNARLDSPEGVAVDGFGNLFIADTFNNVIRKVGTNGIITTVAGNGYGAGLGYGGYSGDGGTATNTSLNYPIGVAVDASGNLFIADTDNLRIREVMLFAGYPTLTLCNVTTNNAGNYTVIITNLYGSVTSSVATLMVRPEDLHITPATGFTASGYVGGPFSITNETFSLANTGTNSLNWTLVNTSVWLNASPSGGTLTKGGPATNVVVSLNTNAYSLTPGIYTATIWFTDLNSGVGQSRQFILVGTVLNIAIQRATPGLRIFAKSTAEYARDEIGTVWQYAGWYDGPFPVSYSFTLTNMPALSAGMQAHIFLIPLNYLRYGAYDNSYADSDATNAFALVINNALTGTNQNYGAWVGYKTNAPGVSLNLGSAAPVVNLATNFSTTVYGPASGNGTWTLKFTDNMHGTVTGPGLSPVTFTIPPGVSAQFANPLVAYFGIQPNSVNGVGQYVDFLNIRITIGGSDWVNDNFASGLGNWTVLGSDAGGVWDVTPDSAWWLNWTTPANGYDVEVAPSLTVPASQWIHPAYYSGYYQELTETLEGTKLIWTLISTNNLPPGATNGFFRLHNPANYP